jgi:NADH-quinone oxidoreductase subunit H
MRFALFFLAEYAGMITTSAVCVALFFGGWHIPWIDKIWPIWGAQDPASPAVTTSLAVCIVRAIAYFVKTLAVIGIFMWVRWSLPRFRFDQIMNLAWRALIPIALVILLATAILIWLMGATARPYMRVGGWMAIWLLIVNAIALAVIVAGSLIVPAAPDTNRRLRIPGSRFNVTPVPRSVAMPG